MLPSLQPSGYPLVTAREILLIGFDRGIDGDVFQSPGQGDLFHFFAKNKNFQAFQWLEERVKNLDTFQLPYAVFCHADWLNQDQFRLLQQMAAHPSLYAVPFIVVADKEQVPDKKWLLSKGVDDCYTIPVNWPHLEQRLDFLNQYKPYFLAETSETRTECFQLKIPRAKRILDVAGASFGILFTCWIWLPVMLAIWLETRGPVIYQSKRVGYGYKVFDFLKFRSMYDKAEEQLQDVEHLNQYQLPFLTQKPVFVKIANDPRITRVGKFIRKYSIDELPQLINVLRGDMSLVGNRPLPLYEAEALTRDEWSARFLAPAGITGLWQVTRRGRPEMTVEERVLLDIDYSRRPYSIWEDMKIMIQTFGAFVQQEDV